MNLEHSRDLERAAQQLLERNSERHVWNGRSYIFSVPSRRTYPFQWFWDSCFHAIVWARFDLERAKEELRALLSGQRTDGFIPHIIYWDQTKLRLVPWANHWTETCGRWSFLPWATKPRTTELMQPPVLAQAVERIWRSEGSDTFLTEVLPTLNRYYEWLRTKRDPDRDHLLTIIAPYESGIDSCPAYDKLIGYRPGGRWSLRLTRFLKVLFINALVFDYDLSTVLERGPFHVEDVLVNALYAHNLGILATLNRAVGDRSAADDWERESLAVQGALVAKCWDPERGAFFNLNDRAERRSTELTILSLMPLVLPRLPRPIVETLVESHLRNEREFWLPYPVSSVAATEPTFTPDSRLPGERYAGLWRGSTWVNTNWFLVHSLRQHGYSALADELANKTRELVARAGFREYFNPLTGQGLGAENFGWSTLVVDFP